MSDYENTKEIKQKSGKEDGWVVFMLENKGSDEHPYCIEVHSYVSDKKVRVNFKTLEECEGYYETL